MKKASKEIVHRKTSQDETQQEESTLLINLLLQAELEKVRGKILQAQFEVMGRTSKYCRSGTLIRKAEGVM